RTPIKAGCYAALMALLGGPYRVSIISLPGLLFGVLGARARAVTVIVLQPARSEILDRRSPFPFALFVPRSVPLHQLTLNRVLDLLVLGGRLELAPLTFPLTHGFSWWTYRRQSLLCPPPFTAKRGCWPFRFLQWWISRRREWSTCRRQSSLGRVSPAAWLRKVCDFTHPLNPPRSCAEDASDTAPDRIETIRGAPRSSVLNRSRGSRCGGGRCEPGAGSRLAAAFGSSLPTTHWLGEWPRS